MKSVDFERVIVREFHPISVYHIFHLKKSILVYSVYKIRLKVGTLRSI